MVALGEEKLSENSDVKRSLKTRHLSMIALGGSIGTGLFVASGSAVSKAGPGGSIIAYMGIGIMVFFLMTSLGEMATYMPVSGSFATYARRFVDPAFGFAMGWNYWLNWVITLAVDISTIGIVFRFWFPGSYGTFFSLIAFILIFLINALSVSSFGETEYWLAIIKVITVIFFLIVGLLTIVGIIGGRPVYGNNFVYRDAPFVGGLPAIVQVFLVAGFSFQGTELIGITAGESETPSKSIPKAIKQVFWRILIFYILSIAVIAALIPYTSSNLLGTSATDITISPFTLVFKRAGLAGAASIMNAVILTSVLSSANSGMYASTRMLFSLAVNGDAPSIFSRVNSRGIPMPALLATGLIGLLIFCTSIFGNHIYAFLVSASGLSGFITWLGVAVSHYRFRRAFVTQGHKLSELKYHAMMFPFGPIIAMILCLIVIFGQDLGSFLNLDWQNIIISYMAVPIFLILFIYYKRKHHTKLIPLNEVNLEKNN